MKLGEIKLIDKWIKAFQEIKYLRTMNLEVRLEAIYCIDKFIRYVNKAYLTFT